MGVNGLNFYILFAFGRFYLEGEHALGAECRLQFMLG